MKELERILNELNGKNINLGDLEIIQEINYQSKYLLEIKLTEEEKQKVFEEIHRAWLKSEDLEIYKITTTVLENFDRLENMSTWDIIEESCWR